MHAQELFSRGISTSCFGAGADYDEYLLEAMANLGGGNFHFLETAQAIPLVFEREFDEIISMVLKDVKITLTLPEAVSAHVAGNWYAKREGNSLVITLGSLATEQEQSVYLTLDNLVSSNGNMIEIPVAVTGVDRDQNPQEVRAMISFSSLPEAEEAAQPQDAGLMERFAVVDLAYKTSQALKLERDGERDAGVRFLRQSLTSHRGNISDDTFSKYETMSNKMYLGLDKAERKRRHYEQYTSQRGWQSIRDYPLHFVNGALMAEIDGLSVLVHSSGGDSFGRVAEWFFLDDVYKLPQSHNELSLDELAKSMGVQIDLVMGMDILKDLYVRIDPYRMLISFSRKPLPSSGWRVDLDKLGNDWACSLNLAGVEQRMRLMTAAGLSFVPENLTTGLKPEGHQQVQWLNFPAFETRVFQLEVTFGEKRLPVMCGILPGEVRKALDLGASEGILGGTFFEGPPSTLAFPDRKWIIYI
jgi:Ca-activated chloride channel family protein